MSTGVRKVIAIAVLALCGCSHVALSGADLMRVSRPAFVSRIDEGAGPDSELFQDDGHYAPRLRGMDPKEADRRLRLKLAKGITRFEISDRLRAETLGLLPKERPWTQTVDPSAVASVFESFLVEEVPAREPDYALLEQLGADSVVELVVQKYGLKSKDGKAAAFIEGYGRLFLLGTGQELWRESFSEDGFRTGAPKLDPLRVARAPAQFREAVDALIDRVAEHFSKELSPRGYHPGAPAKLLDLPQHKKAPKQPNLPPNDELPPP
jgi:hypothetical protein